MTRSGKKYDSASIDESSREAPIEEIETVTLDLDSEPYFERALLADCYRGATDSDDCEGHTLTDDRSPPSHQDVVVKEVPRPAASFTKKNGRAKDQVHSKARRRAQERRKAREFPKLPPKYRPHLAILRLCSAINHTFSDLCSEDLPAAAGGWVGKRPVVSQDSTVVIEELKSRGFSSLRWNGIKPHMISDRKRRIMVALAGKPTDADWDDLIDEASNLLTTARELALATRVFKASEMSHRRGRFFQLPTGVSFGGGSTRPGNLAHTVGEQNVLKKLLAHRSIKRIVGFQHASFALYAPKLYEHYRKTLARLYEHEPHLQPNFPSISPFPAMTFNLGPSTATVEHADFGNVAHGWCAITALGNYDPDKEGHLILYDLKLIITFPPGSTVLIPSAVFRHGNTQLVAPNSYRQSITQYCAGGLFRWVRYGFRTGKDLAALDPSGKMKKDADGDLQTKTQEALSLFSTLDSLADDRAKILRSS
ncbi:hypothetical protein CVT26_007541 [Gymnopilus dilepis]|uniref:Uncharacterized protein n=1 Tax=Gymnopilus dilepis TaxID=231916 RepID=A0A409WZ42_9AGAR|nr:hypothetical protein CVT26_007541 [Gymnopilus dilepis]